MPVREQSAALARAFGLAVREQRTRLGISQEQLGFAADLDRTYVSGIERGTRNPTLRILWQISKALKTAPSGLLQSAERSVRRSRGS